MKRPGHADHGVKQSPVLLHIEKKAEHAVTSNGSHAATNLLDVARATLRTTFLARLDLRAPRLFFDLRFVAAKVASKLRRIARRKARRNRWDQQRTKFQAPTSREIPSFNIQMPAQTFGSFQD